eukprot:2231321-Ditylum_brightwellii.AAC.1
MKWKVLTNNDAKSKKEPEDKQEQAIKNLIVASLTMHILATAAQMKKYENLSKMIAKTKVCKCTRTKRKNSHEGMS